MDTLSAMALFVRVAETRSFTEAARQLRVTPSAVSRSVARLEHELDARLLHRSTHAVALTEAGQVFFERAARLVADFDEARDAIQAQRRPRGTLRIDAPLGVGRLVVGPALPGFLERFPDLRVELSLRDRFVDPVAEGMDVLVRVGRPKEASLSVRTLRTGRMVVCGSRGYLRKKGAPRAVADLARHECLGFLRAGRARPWVFGEGDSATEFAPQGRFATDNAELLRDAAVSGAGLVCLLDVMLARDLAAGALEAVLEGEVTERRPVVAMQPMHRHPSAKSRAFVDYMVAALAADPRSRP